jgi:drug/metabolite transporter (DMT)-like permease
VRVAAVLLGLALFAGLVVLAVAGVTAATAVLVTAGAVVVMIGLGNAVGGRHTPNRAPHAASAADEAASADEAGTSEDAGR